MRMAALTVLVSLASTNAAASSEANFTLVRASVASCPLANCDKWPSADHGTVYLYESQEVFAATSLQRFFYVFVPIGLQGPAPLVVYLHGGFLSGAKQITLGEFPSWAAGQQTTWNRNTASCTFTYENLFSQTFRTADGRRCEPEVVTTDAPTGFVVVYPSGLADRGLPSSAFGNGHWEDGRSPSPGWAINASDETDGTEYRDDVGFISHVIETVSSSLVHPTSSPPVVLPLIDTSRVVVGGTSNGGIMTHRVACNAGHPAYPGLQHLSAAMIIVAAMPLNVREGQRGRAACAPQKPLRVVYTVGTGFPTPDCTVYGCQQQTVDGDSRLPFGSNGITHNANAPTLGRLISHADSMNALVEANATPLARWHPRPT